MVAVALAVPQGLLPRWVYQQFASLYQEQTGGRESLRLIDIDVTQYKILLSLTQSSGKETDHSRGHWPVDAYIHLVAAQPMLEAGFDYTVYVDPDHFFLDSSLVAEIPRVRGIGCISAIPPACLVSSDGGPRQLKDIHQEYRLVADADLRDKVRAAAAPFGGYSVRNSTNSGLVVYNNRFLSRANWSDWLHTLFEISPKGFYGDQTALTVAFGRNDIPIYWLPNRFNVALTLPRAYVQSTCGQDATYSEFGAHPDLDHPVSSVHFIWGPKPWMAAMVKPHPLHSAAVQSDLKYVNLYREFARRVLPSRLRSRLFHEYGMSPLNKTDARVVPSAYIHCRQAEDPCRIRV